MNMLLLNFIAETPKWTDVVSALSALIGVPLVLYTLYKLMKKDKERASEIQSLSTIAAQLTDMQVHTTKRYKASKKPHIEIALRKPNESNRVLLDFTNTNKDTSITKYELANEVIDFSNLNFTKMAINDVNGEQQFSIVLNGKNKPIEYLILQIDYTTEEGYVFIQDIVIWRDNDTYLFSPRVVIDKENSAI